MTENPSTRVWLYNHSPDLCRGGKGRSWEDERHYPHKRNIHDCTIVPSPDRLGSIAPHKAPQNVGAFLEVVTQISAGQSSRI